MATGDYRIGLHGVFYYGDEGSTPNTEADNVRNCTLSMTARNLEAVRRGKKWVANKVYIKEAVLTFNIFDIEGDAFFSAVQTAYMNGTRIALYPCDANKGSSSSSSGEPSGGEGLDADWYITNFSRNEDNEDWITYDVEARPTDELRDPSWG
jgi:hypothetical protein